MLGEPVDQVARKVSMVKSLSLEQMLDMAAAAHFHAREFADLYGQSPRQTHRHIMRLFGCSTREWLDAMKLVAAKKRLAGDGQIKTVALDYFQHTPHFCRWFKQRTDVTPSEYQARRADRPDSSDTSKTASP